jgi:hypothetical protein
MIDRISDPRVQMALQLLYEVLGSTEVHPKHPEFAAQRSFAPSPAVLPDEEMSATDLLSWWFQPTSGLSNPWNDYFDQSFQPAMVTPLQTSRQDGGRAAQLVGQSPASWMSVLESFKEPTEELSDEYAEAVVGCLYDFLHAFGRRDIDAAMEYVSEDFHIFEGGKEIDRLGLRQQLEALLGSLRDWEFEVSPVEIPIPIYHSCGALIYVEIQVEAYHPQENLWRSIVEYRIAVFKQQGLNEWKISALSPVEEVHASFV